MLKPKLSPEVQSSHEGAFSLENGERGIMRLRYQDDVTMIINRNPANEHMFRENEEGHFEVVYQGSGMIADMLCGENETASSRALAFFDVHGNFHDQMTLKDLLITKAAGSVSIKHCAVFEDSTIAVDDIFCLSIARPIEN